MVQNVNIVHGLFVWCGVVVWHVIGKVLWCACCIYECHMCGGEVGKEGFVAGVGP